MTPPVRILLADEYEIVLQGLVRIIECLPFAAETALAQTGRNALRLAGNSEFDLCIVDPALPDRRECPVVETLHTHCPQLCVLLHTAERWTEARLAQYGIRGFVSKTSDAQTLGRAIACVLSGSQYLDENRVCPRSGGGNLPCSANGKLKSCKVL